MVARPSHQEHHGIRDSGFSSNKNLGGSGLESMAGRIDCFSYGSTVFFYERVMTFLEWAHHVHSQSPENWCIDTPFPVSDCFIFLLSFFCRNLRGFRFLSRRYDDERNLTGVIPFYELFFKHILHVYYLLDLGASCFFPGFSPHQGREMASWLLYIPIFMCFSLKHACHFFGVFGGSDMENAGRLCSKGYIGASLNQLV